MMQTHPLQNVLATELRFDTVRAMADHARQQSDLRGQLDLGAVQSMDSAGLALLVHWKCRCPTLLYCNVSTAAADLARLSGVAWIFDTDRAQD